MKKLPKEFEINADSIKVVKRTDDSVCCYNNDILIMKILADNKNCVVYDHDYKEYRISYEDMEYDLRNNCHAEYPIEVYVQAKKVADAVIYMRDNFDAIMEELKDFE